MPEGVGWKVTEDTLIAGARTAGRWAVMKYGRVPPMVKRRIFQLASTIEPINPLDEHLDYLKKHPLHAAFTSQLASDNMPNPSTNTTAAQAVEEQLPKLAILCTGLAMGVGGSRVTGEIFRIMMEDVVVGENLESAAVVKHCRSKSLRKVIGRDLYARRRTFQKTFRKVRLVDRNSYDQLTAATPKHFAELLIEIKTVFEGEPERITHHEQPGLPAKRRVIRVLNGRGYEGMCALLATLYPITIAISGIAVEPTKPKGRMGENRVWVDFEYDGGVGDTKIMEWADEDCVQQLCNLVAGAQNRLRQNALTTEQVLFMAAEMIVDSEGDLLEMAKEKHANMTRCTTIQRIAFETLHRFSGLVEQISAPPVRKSDQRPIWDSPLPALPNPGAKATSTFELLLGWSKERIQTLRQDVNCPFKIKIASKAGAADTLQGFRAIAGDLLYCAFLGAVFSHILNNDHASLTLLVDDRRGISPLRKWDVMDMLNHIPQAVQGYKSFDSAGPTPSLASIVRNGTNRWLCPSIFYDPGATGQPLLEPLITVAIDAFPLPEDFRTKPARDTLEKYLRYAIDVTRLVSSEVIPETAAPTNTAPAPANTAPARAKTVHERTLVLPCCLYLGRQVDVQIISEHTWGRKFQTLEEGHSLVLATALLGSLDLTVTSSIDGMRKEDFAVEMEEWEKVMPHHIYGQLDDPERPYFVVTSLDNIVGRRLAIYGATRANKRSLLFLGDHKLGLAVARKFEYQVLIL